MMIKCCQCLKIIKPEDDDEPVGLITHSYCEACYDDVMAEIKSWDKELIERSSTN